MQMERYNRVVHVTSVLPYISIYEVLYKNVDVVIMYQELWHFITKYIFKCLKQ
jgi:hypothetical protein